MALASIIAGLVTRLDTISGLRVYAEVPGDVHETPCAYVYPLTGEYHPTFGAEAAHTIRVTVLVAMQDITEAQNNLEPYLAITGSSSVRAAIQTDRTLGSAAEDAIVERYADYGVHEFGDTSYFGVNFEIEVQE